MRDWLQRTPVWFRLAFFFGAIWLLVIVLRLLGLTANDEVALFRWADARYFAAMWAIFVAVHYASSGAR